MTQLLKVSVARKSMLAEAICGFDLVPLPGESLPSFTPGAHIDVHLPGGIIRQYSLCNDSATPDLYRIAVLREAEGRGGSTAMHESVQEGDVLTIGAPRNHFPLASGTDSSILVAGGIGITPLLAMVQELASARRGFELHYCTRNEARMAFRELLMESRFAGGVHIHRDDGPADQRFDPAQVLQQAPGDAHLYVCGPGGFIQWVLDTATQCGWSEDRMHREYFSAAAVSQTGADAAFDVVLASSGKVVRVAVGQTIVHALATAGVEVATSCEQGICGTCVTRVLDGVPDHRDLFLTPDEQAANDQLTPCCSRSKSPRLVLDL
ncbi:PDR/VanB family oxidoreductase [Ralstonia sp.]|uniref:PDR/VanB family oxidoreductase n=1 Tax=Ralstonia sp. TaxID=54061 RepID=UPI0031D53FB8